MPAFLLTDENIDFAKRTLQSRLPTMKSSHRIEAFANGLGFSTYAALLASIKAADKRRPVLCRADPSHFAKRALDLYGSTVDEQICTDVIRATDLPTPIWCFHRERDHDAANRWFAVCDRRGIPYIHLESRRRYATLNWDFICVDKDDQAHIRGAAGTAMVEAMFQRYQAHVRVDPGKSLFYGSAYVGSVKRLLPDVARDLADEFFSMLYTPMVGRIAA